MKGKLPLLTAAILMCAGMAFAQGGTISLFADVSGADCNLRDAAPGLCNVFIVHVSAPAVSGSEFGVSEPTCLLAAFLSYTPIWGVDIAANPAAPLQGRSVGYGGCFGSPILVGTLAYFCQALTGPCCIQGVIAHSITGVVSAVDCNSNPLTPTCSVAYWNPNAGCTCNVGNGGCTVAVHTTTWGQIKSMYE